MDLRKGSLIQHESPCTDKEHGGFCYNGIVRDGICQSFSGVNPGFKVPGFML